MIAKTLAIDFGTKRVGVAVSYWTLAEPIVTLPNDERLFYSLKKIAEDEQVEQVLIGISEQDMAEQSKQFATELQKYLKLPTLFADETLSSYTVERRLRAEGIKKSTRSGAIDHFAAAQFLQDWLDEQPSS